MKPGWLIVLILVVMGFSIAIIDARAEKQIAQNDLASALLEVERLEAQNNMLLDVVHQLRTGRID